MGGRLASARTKAREGGKEEGREGGGEGQAFVRTCKDETGEEAEDCTTGNVDNAPELNKERGREMSERGKA